MKNCKTLSPLHTLKIMLPLSKVKFCEHNKSMLVIFLAKKLNLQCGFWCAPFWRMIPGLSVLRGKLKNDRQQQECFSPERIFSCLLYTMRCVWLIIDNFDNIRTNTTDQSQLTVGLWPVFKPVGTPRNTCSAQLFQKGANPLWKAGLSMPIFDIPPPGLQ